MNGGPPGSQQGEPWTGLALAAFFFLVVIAIAVLEYRGRRERAKHAQDQPTVEARSGKWNALPWRPILIACLGLALLALCVMQVIILNRLADLENTVRGSSYVPTDYGEDLRQLHTEVGAAQAAAERAASAAQSCSSSAGAAAEEARQCTYR